LENINVLEQTPRPFNAFPQKAVALERAYCIALAPVSWGDGFMRDVSILALKTSCGKLALGSAYTHANKLKAAWDHYAPLIDFSHINPNQTLEWVRAVNQANANHGFIQDEKGEDVVPALSAINIALWDLLGQCLNQPLCQLIGGHNHANLKAYASLEIDYDTNGPQRDFELKLYQMLEQGFRAIKLYLPRFGYQTSELSSAQWQHLEAQYISQARAIVGPNIDLMLDTFGSAHDWPDDLAWAERLKSLLTEYNYVWFEEPLSPNNRDGFKQLKQQKGCKITGGEFFTRMKDFNNWCEHQLVDIIQPDCTIAGGLSTLLAVRQKASANNIDVIPHGWSSAVGLAADVQFLSATQPEGYCILEYMPSPHVTDILKNNPFYLNTDGYIKVPTQPGLGINLDWHKAQAGLFPFTGLML